MKKMQNLYEVRKSLRFELKPMFLNPPKVKESNDLKKDINSFIEKYEQMLFNFSEIVFDFRKEKLNKKLKIKFSFLKTHTKNQYYENDVEKLITINKW